VDKQGEVQFSSVQFSSVQFSSVQFSSVYVCVCLFVCLSLLKNNETHLVRISE